MPVRECGLALIGTEQRPAGKPRLQTPKKKVERHAQTHTHADRGCAFEQLVLITVWPIARCKMLRQVLC